MSRQLVLGVALSAALLAPLVACSERVAGPVLVLKLASPDPATEINGGDVTHFADEVNRRSQGTMRIEPVWDVTPEGAHGWDQVVARGVANGTYDLGLVPSRAWDVLGVRSLRAINTPFLMTSTTVVQDVLDNDVLRADLLSDLGRAGVVGLDLYPERLRRPFGFEQPLLGLEDYRGATIRSPRSTTVNEMLRAFGATAVVDDPIDPSKQRGMESSFGLSGTGFVTGNVVFFPKVETLVANIGVRDRLRADQWAILRSAASETRRWLAHALPSEPEAAAEFCREGGKVATASSAELEALARAAESVVTGMRRDPVTARLIDAIRSVAGKDARPEVVSGCPAPRPTPAPGHELSTLDGVYRARVTQSVLRRAGVTDPNVVRQNAGKFIWTLDHGTWTYDQRAPYYISDAHASGRYTYEDGHFRMWWDATEYVDARLQIDPDGTIHFLDVEDHEPQQQALSDGFYSVPWQRVSDLPR